MHSYFAYPVCVSSKIYDVMCISGFKTGTLVILGDTLKCFMKLFKFLIQTHFEVSLNFIMKLQLAILYFIALPLLFILSIFNIKYNYVLKREKHRNKPFVYRFSAINIKIHQHLASTSLGKVFIVLCIEQLIT